MFQRVDGACHGQVGLARAGRTDAEGQVVGPYVLQVGGLVRAARPDILASRLDADRRIFVVGRLANVRQTGGVVIHKRLLQHHVHAFRIEALLPGHFEQRQQYVATDLRCARRSCDPESIASTRNLDIEAAFDLPQVFIKLTAQVGKAVIVGGLENHVSRNLHGAQNFSWLPL